MSHTRQFIKDLQAGAKEAARSTVSFQRIGKQVLGGFQVGRPDQSGAEEAVHRRLLVAPVDGGLEGVAAAGDFVDGVVGRLDVEGLGSLNDLNKDLVIDQPYTVLVKKDQFECGKVFLDVSSDPNPRQPPRPLRSDRVESFQVLVNGVSRRVPAGEVVEIGPSDVLVIQDIAPVTGDYDKIKVNFVGFVGNKRYNDTEDRGYRIQADDLWKRHSLNKRGRLCKVEALLEGKAIGEIRVRVVEESEP